MHKLVSSWWVFSNRRQVMIARDFMHLCHKWLGACLCAICQNCILLFSVFQPEYWRVLPNQIEKREVKRHLRPRDTFSGPLAHRKCICGQGCALNHAGGAYSALLEPLAPGERARRPSPKTRSPLSDFGLKFLAFGPHECPTTNSWLCLWLPWAIIIASKGRLSPERQENHAIAKMSARCAQYMSALKIFESVD